jgi:hypothetical protein
MLERHPRIRRHTRTASARSSPPMPPSLVSLSPAPRRAAPVGRAHLRNAVIMLDRILRRCQGVFEFSDDGACLLRVAVIRATVPVRLESGVEVAVGASIGDLHIWNEHLPTIPYDGVDIGWICRVRGRMLDSLAMLADCVATRAEFSDVVAFRARIAFVRHGQIGKIDRVAGALGLERVTAAPNLGRRVHDFFENFWLWGLVVSFNPAGGRNAATIRQRHELWISRSALLARYASHPAPAAQTDDDPITLCSTAA